MKKALVIIIIVLLVTSSAWAQPGDAIVGKYHLPNQLDIEIFKSNEKYLGKIIGLDGFNDGQKKDMRNPEVALRNDLLMGKVIITNLEYDELENEWVNGSMYGPEKGLVFNLKISEIRQDEIEVVASKYFFRKTLTWRRL